MWVASLGVGLLGLLTGGGLIILTAFRRHPEQPALASDRRPRRRGGGRPRRLGSARSAQGWLPGAAGEARIRAGEESRAWRLQGDRQLHEAAVAALDDSPYDQAPQLEGADAFKDRQIFT